MEQLILKSLRITNWSIAILLGLLCTAAFVLFAAHLTDGSPTKLDTFYQLTIPFIMLVIFLSIRIELNRKRKLSDFSKIDYFLVLCLVILLIASIRVAFFAFHSISLSHGGRQIDLPIENCWATASGGPSIRFFGGVRKGMSCSVLDGHKILWEFETEAYPHTLNWRDSSITFDDKNKTVTFSQGSLAFGSITLVTPNIMTMNDVKEVESQSEQNSKSPNGKFTALVQSKKNRMKFLVSDSSQNILWTCEMINCSTVIDGKDCDIVWGDNDVIYKYESSGNYYLNRFHLQTGHISESSFMY